MAYTASDQLTHCDYQQLFVFENWFCEMVRNNPQSSNHEDTCATVDTGCQRLAIGSSTLRRYTSFLPKELKVTLHPEINRFKSVHQVSTTTRVPSALGGKGCFLRPAVFDCEQSEQAPFLISLTFLLHCDTELRLSQEHGLHIRFRGSQEILPLHLGPTGALRIPLQQFNMKKINILQRAQEELREKSREEFEVLNLSSVDAGIAQSKKDQPSKLPAASSASPRAHGALGKASAWQPGDWHTSGSVLDPNDSEGLQGDDAGLQHDGPSDGAQAEPEATGDQIGQQHGHGGADLHQGVCQRTDPQEGAGDGQPGSGILLDGDVYYTTARPAEDRGDGRTGVGHAHKLVESYTDTEDTVGDQYHHHSGKDRGEDRRRGWLGAGLRGDPDVLLRHGGSDPPEPEGRPALREDILPMPPTNRTPMPLLPVDHLPALPRRGELQVQVGKAVGLDLCRSDESSGTREVPSQDHHQSRVERLRPAGDVHHLQEGAHGQEEDARGKGGEECRQERTRPGFRGVPEVPRVAAPAESEVSGAMKELPAKTARKIKSAIKKAVSFWRQIQLILGGFQDGNRGTTITEAYEGSEL